MDLPACTAQTTSLRSFTDKMEMHLRSLEAQSENVSQPIFLTLILSKLPRDVKLQLELMKEGEEWDMCALRKCLQDFLTAKEHADGAHSTVSDTKPETYRKHISSGQTLVASSAQPKCVYCSERHYSDECTKYPYT